ncbi:MAG: tetratricopeptide repeat protein [Candidatus Wallbacteria bacterium]
MVKKISLHIHICLLMSILVFQLSFIFHSTANAANQAESYFDKGHTCYWSGDYDETIKYLTKAIEIKPDWKYYEVRADAYMQKHEYDKAIKDCDALISLKPDYYVPYLRKGDALREKHEYNQAMDNYNKAIKMNCELAYLHRGDLYLILNDCDNAIKDYETMMKLF